MAWETWVGADGASYYKDANGYVYRNNQVVGRDLPSGQSVSAAPQGNIRPQGVPTNFIWNGNSWVPGSGGGGYGGGQMPGGQAVNPWQQSNLQGQQQLAVAGYQQQMQALQLAQQQQQAAINSANSQNAATLELERQRLAQEADVSRQQIEIQRQQQAAEAAKDQMLRREAIMGVESDPRKFVQSLFLRNMDNAQVANYLNQLPYVQSLRTGEPMQNASLPALPGLQDTGTPPSWEQIQGAQQAAASPGGQNPLFSFIQGRKLDPRQTLYNKQTGSPLMGLTESLASYAGQDPGEVWGEFEEFLPRGGRLGPSTYR